ncbi:MAG: hypothetical protein DRR19_09900 [Candidatus Parabeggiatoa sp. nov. 1]|nr:MAG: hypothetical protein DRR19_09900 [Gammaproteobacteria bacterium]
MKRKGHLSIFKNQKITTTYNQQNQVQRIDGVNGFFDCDNKYNGLTDLTDFFIYFAPFFG